MPRNSVDEELAEHLVARARQDGVSLVGADGLLSGVVSRRLSGFDQQALENRSNPVGRVPGWTKSFNTLVVTYGEPIESAVK